MKIISKQNMLGFTLVETMVAVGVVMIGFTAVLSLSSTSLFHISSIQDRLIATNLAAEGIEVIRNIRDTNWLQNQSWDLNLSDKNYQAAYNSVPPLLSYGDIAYRDVFLSIDSNGFYNYGSGAPTKYKRNISITHITSYEIRVVSTVNWKIRNIDYSASVEDHLFDWK
ncbi:MAG: prepilin-type N-terminal cleavage/methylation domain-containing protein [Candidatus Azambacteria bacterium]|nr:prepilin-type N-terminal cleavage/methylation domain-containing protein [Candidatus Azambacteria bacterium]